MQKVIQKRLIRWLLGSQSTLIFMLKLTVSYLMGLITALTTIFVLFASTLFLTQLWLGLVRRAIGYFNMLELAVYITPTG